MRVAQNERARVIQVLVLASVYQAANLATIVSATANSADKYR